MNSRKLLALVGLFLAFIPPTIFVCFDKMPASAFSALVLAMMGGVATYMHSTALEDVAAKANTSTPIAGVLGDTLPPIIEKLMAEFQKKPQPPPIPRVDPEEKH